MFVVCCFGLVVGLLRVGLDCLLVNDGLLFGGWGFGFLGGLRLMVKMVWWWFIVDAWV